MATLIEYVRDHWQWTRCCHGRAGGGRVAEAVVASATVVVAVAAALGATVLAAFIAGAGTAVVAAYVAVANRLISDAKRSH